jgi:hypothetical protein
MPTTNQIRIIFSSTVMRASSNFNLHAEPFCATKVVDKRLGEDIFPAPNLQKMKESNTSKSCMMAVTMNIIRQCG